MLNLNQIHHGDCLELMAKIPSNYIDAIIVDPPYGTTSCKWDTIIPFEPMWEQINRIIKPNSAICIFGSEPFSSLLRQSNLKNYKYDWIWNKKLAGNGVLAKKQPLKIHELVSVFANGSCHYIPQMRKGKLRKKMTGNPKISEINGGDGKKCCKETYNDHYYPVSILDYSLAGLRKDRLHPTQKSLDLIEYLIKTYTVEDEIILDFTIGSGTTAIACINQNRNFIGIEKEIKYVEIARQRIKNHAENNEGCI